MGASPVLATSTMKFFLVAAVLAAAVSAQETEPRERPSKREGRVFPDLHEARAFPNFREALYRPMKLSPDYRRGPELFRSVEEERPTQSAVRVPFPDGEYAASARSGCYWVCSGGVCELYCR